MLLKIFECFSRQWPASNAIEQNRLLGVGGAARNLSTYEWGTVATDLWPKASSLRRSKFIVAAEDDVRGSFRRPVRITTWALGTAIALKSSTKKTAILISPDTKVSILIPDDGQNRQYRAKVYFAAIRKPGVCSSSKSTIVLWRSAEIYFDGSMLWFAGLCSDFGKIS